MLPAQGIERREDGFQEHAVPTHCLIIDCEEFERRVSQQMLFYIAIDMFLCAKSILTRMPAGRGKTEAATPHIASLTIRKESSGMNSTTIRMYLNTPKWKSLAAALCGFACFACFVSSAQAALSLTITENTISAITMEISGTIEADTEGVEAGFLGIKLNWSANGVHTDWFKKTPTVESLELVLEPGPGGGGTYSVHNYFAHNNQLPWGDSLVMQANPLTRNSLVAGTEVITGIIRLTGEAGTFDPDDAENLMLVSGINGLGDTDQWLRFEAQAQVVPEPSTAALLLGFGAFAWVAAQRRRSQDATTTRRMHSKH